MLEGMIADVTETFQAVFMANDTMTMAFAIGAIVIAGFMTQRAGQAFNMTFTALLLYVAANYIRDAMTAPADAATNTWVTAAESRWDMIMDLRFSTFLAYFIVFWILVLVVHFIMSVISRRG